MWRNKSDKVWNMHFLSEILDVEANINYLPVIFAHFIIGDQE